MPILLGLEVREGFEVDLLSPPTKVIVFTDSALLMTRWCLLCQLYINGVFRSDSGDTTDCRVGPTVAAAQSSTDELATAAATVTEDCPDAGYFHAS